LYNAVREELKARIQNKDKWPTISPAVPDRFLNGSEKSSSSSVSGSNASKIPFPLSGVDFSSFEMEQSENIPLVQALLIMTQERLKEMSIAFGLKRMSEVGFVHPVIRAFLSVVIDKMDIVKVLQVSQPGEGVSVNVQFWDMSAKGSPDIVIRRVASTKATKAFEKLCKAYVVGEVKLNHEAVVASESQFLWYLFGAAQCISACIEGGLGSERYGFCTDGFSWRFYLSGETPSAPSTKWKVSRSEIIEDISIASRYIAGIMSACVQNTQNAHAEVAEEDMSSTASLPGDNADLNRPWQGGPSASGATRPARDVDSHGPEGEQLGEQLSELSIKNVHVLGGQRLSKLSDALSLQTKQPTSLLLRGDGLPRGLDCNAFVEMSPMEKVISFLERV
jgi:hypothetical protein